MLAVATSCPPTDVKQLLLSDAVKVTWKPVVCPPGFVSESSVVEPVVFSKLMLDDAIVGATAFTVSVAFVPCAPPEGGTRNWSMM
jgi:hypothetical protein